MRFLLSIYLLTSTCLLHSQVYSADGTEIVSFQNMEGAFDNFLQVWQENTKDDLHRVESDEKHEHIHIKFMADTLVENGFNIQVYKGRNNTEFLNHHKLRFIQLDQGYKMQWDNEEPIAIEVNESGFRAVDQSQSMGRQRSQPGLLRQIQTKRAARCAVAHGSP